MVFCPHWYWLHPLEMLYLRQIEHVVQHVPYGEALIKH